MFMLIPIRIKDGSDQSKFPFANSLLIAINVLVFWLGWSENWMVGPGTGLASIVTYGFAHASAWHLIANMWTLLVFGNPVNRRLGNGLYLLAYMGSLVLLGIFARLMVGGHLVGASGAIFSVIAICLLLMPARPLEIFYVALFPVTLLMGLFHRPQQWLGWFIRWDQFEIKAFWAIFLVPLLELWGLFSWGWNWTNLAHLFGLICGVAIVLLLPTAVTMQRRRVWET